MPYINNSDDRNGETPEKYISSGEKQTELRKFKKTFLRNVSKIPELRHLNPEALWDSLDKAKIFKPKQVRLPYQKVRERG